MKYRQFLKKLNELAIGDKAKLDLEIKAEVSDNEVLITLGEEILFNIPNNTPEDKSLPTEPVSSVPRHSFSTRVAKETNHTSALIFEYLRKRVNAQKKFGIGKHVDGKIYTPACVADIQRFFYYLGKSSIRNALKKLEDRRMIVEKVPNMEACKYFAVREKYMEW